MNQEYPYYPYLDVVKKEVLQPIAFPPQHQSPPGDEYLMNPRPIFDYPGYVGSGKLTGKVAIITGGDSGIGRAVRPSMLRKVQALSLCI